LLNGCSHTGKLTEAREIFNSIDENDRGPKITTAMVDTLSRLKLWDEAHSLIQMYEQNHEPNVIMHRALLAGLTRNESKEKAKEIFDKLQAIKNISENDLSSNAILMSNMYYIDGQHDLTTGLRSDLDKMSQRKIPGMSFIEHNGKQHYFYASGSNHPRIDEIKSHLQELSNIMKSKYDHDYNKSLITRNLKETETVEEALCSHSEKLAVAFGDLVYPPKETLIVGKNLRICDDCHRVSKLLSIITNRDIRIRDSTVFHLFKNGSCSCNDFW